MESILDSISKVELPRDLSFIRAMLSAAIKRSEGKLTSDEVSDLEKAYSSLWLGERKPEGLDYNLQKFQIIAEQMKSEKLRQTTILLSVFLVVVVALVIGIKLFYSR
jgi:hypothetical protein